jgi:heme-degrading monooxygenase HmoA
MIRVVVVPLHALSDVAMWQAPRLRRALKAARRRGVPRRPSRNRWRSAHASRPHKTKVEIQAKEMIQMAMQLQEMDEQVMFRQQLDHDTGPVVLINRFNVPQEDAERLVQAWAEDAAYMKQQPGYISTQLHRGIAGSSTFINVAVWESAHALAKAFGSPEFQAHMSRYPDGTVAAPHLFEKIAVAGICVG